MHDCVALHPEGYLDEDEQRLTMSFSFLRKRIFIIGEPSQRSRNLLQNAIVGDLNCREEAGRRGDLVSSAMHSSRLESGSPPGFEGDWQGCCIEQPSLRARRCTRRRNRVVDTRLCNLALQKLGRSGRGSDSCECRLREGGASPGGQG